MIDWQEIAVTVAIYLGMALMGAAALFVVWRFTSWVKPPMLPMQRRPFISWHGIDVLVAFFIMIGIPALVAETLLKAGVFELLYGENNDAILRSRGQLLPAALAAPLLLGLLILGLEQLRGTRLGELGLTARKAWNNVAVGYGAWLIVTPTALAIFYVAVQLTPEGYAEEHPIVRATDQPLEAWEWVLFFALTMVLVPLYEELVFRGILLPWQVQGGWEPQAIIAFCAVVVASLSGFRGEDKPYNPGPVAFVFVVLSVAWILIVVWQRRLLGLTRTPDPLPDEASAREADAAVETHISAPSRASMLEGVSLPDQAERIERKLSTTLAHPAEAQVQATLAICMNGLLFAAFHSSAWPSPIPLLLVGVALAWVRYRTSSLVGAVILHALFNGVSAIEMFVNGK